MGKVKNIFLQNKLSVIRKSIIHFIFDDYLSLYNTLGLNVRGEESYWLTKRLNQNIGFFNVRLSGKATG